MIKKLSEDYEQELIAIRRELHKIPELGTKEFKTSAYIKAKLDELGIFYKECYNTGIIAYIKGKEKGNTILLRADIDALPLKEETNLEFSSTHDGFMHACGHDIHMTCLLGAAKILNQLKSDLDGTVILVFQPDEEGDGGALKMIEEGGLDSADIAFSLHIEPLCETGTILIKDGSIMASPDDFSIEIIGKGGHGACPEKCINPINIASEIIMEYNNLTEENKRVVSVCTINSGTKSPNIIPEKAIITGTARTLDENVRKATIHELNSIADKICSNYGAEYIFKFNKLFPPLINNKHANKIILDAANKLDLKVEFLDKPSMTGDDFAYFAQIIPSSYFKLGVGKNESYPLHNSKLNPDEGAIKLGAAVLAQATLDYIRG